MEGVHALFNNGEAGIRWQSADAGGADILKQGTLCAIRGSYLCHDNDAVLAQASEDDMSASVQWVMMK